MKDPKNKYGRHIAHRTSWLDIANKKLPELDNKSIIEYVKENTDLKDPSMFIASLFEEGLAARIYNNDSIARDGKDRGSTTGNNYEYPYSGYFDFGLDTIGNNLEKFINKGYLDPDIKNRILLHEVGNERGQSVTTADFKNFGDVIKSKIAYLKDSEENLNKFIENNQLDLSDNAKEYFKYVAYNAGLGNAQNMIKSFNERDYLKDDQFLKDDFEPEYWKDPYKYSMRRWQGADMLRNEFNLKPINRTFEDPIEGPTNINPDFLRREQTPIQSTPVRSEDDILNLPVYPTAVPGVKNKEKPFTVEAKYIDSTPIDSSKLKRGFSSPKMKNPLDTEDFFLGGLLGDSVGGKTGSGALSGAMSGFTMGSPWGALAGGLLGGASSLINAKKEQEMEAKMKQQEFSEFISSANINQSNGSNIPMKYGGKMYANGGMLSPMFSEFNEGGTHESNPLGGIPQGVSPEGKQRTVEEGETKFKFKDGEYVFSNRLTPLNYDF